MLENSSCQSPSAPKASLFTGIRAVATSGPVAGIIGASIVTIPVTLIGAGAFALVAIWTAVNEYRVATRRQGGAIAVSSVHFGPPRSGIVGWFTEKFYSPGFGPVVQVGCYAYTAAVALVAGSLVIGSIFATFAIGACASAYVGNLGYKPPPREQLVVERYLDSAWELLPKRIKTILRDPGACFCTGNFALIVYQMNFSRMVGGTWSTTLFAGGASLALLGVGRGLFPLVSGRVPTASGMACFLGGMGEIALGTSSLLFGSCYTGTATLFWGISNILYGLKIVKSFAADRSTGQPSLP